MADNGERAVERWNFPLPHFCAMGVGGLFAGITNMSGVGFVVPRAFAAQFRCVSEYYQCPPEEIEMMKAAVRADWENAQICYAELAREIAFAKRIPL